MAVLSLANLITSTRRLINELVNTNSHFTDPEITDYLNQAVTFLGTQMEWPEQVDQATAIPNQALYQLPSDFIELVDVYFNNVNPVKLVILERPDLGQISPAWQTDPASTPRVAYRYNRNTIGLYPVPDANQTDYTIQIQYIYMPATLFNNTDVPDLHTAFQMCLPFYAAFLCETRLGNDKKAEIDLTNFDRHRKALMSKVQKYSDDLLRFRWGWAYPERNT
jgi:hypothetical protein